MYRKIPRRCLFSFLFVFFHLLLYLRFLSFCFLLVFFFLPQAADFRVNVPAGSEAVGVFKATENANTALAAAEAAGLHVVNIGAGDVIAGRSASILGLSCQLIRVHRLAQEKLKVYMMD